MPTSEFLGPFDEVKKYGGKLPHWQRDRVMQFITFRLGDSMPNEKLKVWKEERDIWLRHHPKPWSNEWEIDYHHRFTARLECWLDEGNGEAIFTDRVTREILEDILMRFNGERYEHDAWVIMPNHIHILVTPYHPLDEIVKGWKGVFARKIGKGSIWQRNYRDTMIRGEQHFINAVHYIRKNPQRLKPGTFTLWESARAQSVI